MHFEALDKIFQIRIIYIPKLLSESIRKADIKMAKMSYILLFKQLKNKFEFPEQI